MKSSTIINKAMSYVGTKESPRNSNNVIFNTHYYGTKVSGSAYPWCCAFVWDIFRMCGASSLFYGGKKTAYCPSAWNWYKSKGQTVGKYNGKPGDVVFFGRCQHIGFIVENLGNGYYKTVEGNTSANGSQDNGGAVLIRKRHVSWIYGIARPRYSSEPEKVPTYPTIDLARGSMGVQVKSLQKCLNKIMGTNLVIDGDFGKLTEAVVKTYQRKKKIEDDGEVGPVTRAKIKADITGKAPAKEEKAIDVSWWQKDIDWKKAAADGVTRAIIRCSYTHQAEFKMTDDSYMAKNIKGATANGIKVGVYHYSQATTQTEAHKEAEFVLKAIKPYKTLITLPVVFDWEYGKRLNYKVAMSNGKAINTKICKEFCDTVKKAGYTPMVYANYSTFSGALQYTQVQKFAKIWLAQYSSKPSYSSMDWWQYSSSGSINGIKGKVDVNKVYKK